MNEKKFNAILKKEIPIAWIAGVRFHSFSDDIFKTKVELDLLNQNPFGSMFWAVEGMAAEFAGGMMLLNKIEASGKSIASLVIKNEVIFSKKAVGKIIFTCKEGKMIDAMLQEAIATNSTKTFELTSIGTDEQNDVVAEFKFTWSIKIRK